MMDLPCFQFFMPENLLLPVRSSGLDCRCLPVTLQRPKKKRQTIIYCDICPDPAVMVCHPLEHLFPASSGCSAASSPDPHFTGVPESISLGAMAALFLLRSV